MSVFCTKGGTGKSVVAINLAVALAKRTIQPVVLVDADLQFGDVALMLQLQPTHTIAEAVQAGDRLDGTMLENLLLRHQPSGLLVLAAPTEPSSADQIGRADLARVLRRPARAVCLRRGRHLGQLRRGHPGGPRSRPTTSSSWPGSTS